MTYYLCFPITIILLAIRILTVIEMTFHREVPCKHGIKNLYWPGTGPILN